MIIAKTCASRNVAFKVARMRESIMEDQDELIIRKSDCDEVGSEANNNRSNNKAALEDIGHNADLYLVLYILYVLLLSSTSILLYRQSRGQYEN